MLHTRSVSHEIPARSSVEYHLQAAHDYVGAGSGARRSIRVLRYVDSADFEAADVAGSDPYIVLHLPMCTGDSHGCCPACDADGQWSVTTISSRVVLRGFR